jgi:hypothetical protein
MHRVLYVAWNKWGLKHIVRDVVKDLTVYGASEAAERLVHRPLREKRDAAECDTPDGESLEDGDRPRARSRLGRSRKPWYME